MMVGPSAQEFIPGLEGAGRSFPGDRILERFLDSSARAVMESLSFHIGLDRGDVGGPQGCGAVTFLPGEVEEGLPAHHARAGAFHVFYEVGEAFGRRHVEKNMDMIFDAIDGDHAAAFGRRPLSEEAAKRGLEGRGYPRFAVLRRPDDMIEEPISAQD